MKKVKRYQWLVRDAYGVQFVPSGRFTKEEVEKECHATAVRRIDETMVETTE